MDAPLKKAVDAIVKHTDPDKIILFGSYAIDRQKSGSDYDLLVIKKNLKHQRKFVHKIYLNFNKIGAPIDVLAVDLKRFDLLKDDPYLIYFEVDRNGKVIYEKPKKPRKSKGLAAKI